MSQLKYWVWLNTRQGVGPVETFRLLDQFGTPEAAYFADREEYELAGVKGKRLEALEDKTLDGADRVLGDCDRLGIRILTWQDAEYPDRLRQIDAPPALLYVKGRLPVVDASLTIGMVGTRSSTPYGEGLAGRFAMELSRRGAVIVSGMAQGIDTAALKGALQAGGRPVSVLGGGIDVIYPRSNKWLYADVAAAGALVSEYPPGTEPLGIHFPTRNRIISGLSMGVVVVEAGEPSGALITAREALDQNREVFAVPGPVGAPESVGTNRLIQKGEAKLITCTADILAEYELLFSLASVEDLPDAVAEQRLAPDPSGAEFRSDRPPREKKDPPRPEPPAEPAPPKRERRTFAQSGVPLTDDQMALLRALGDRAMRPDDLVEVTQIPARRVLSALTVLSVWGIVEEQSGNRFFAPADWSDDENTQA